MKTYDCNINIQNNNIQAAKLHFHLPYFLIIFTYKCYLPYCPWFESKLQIQTKLMEMEESEIEHRAHSSNIQSYVFRLAVKVLLEFTRYISIKPHYIVENYVYGTLLACLEAGA
jgi:hypothetical protein